MTSPEAGSLKSDAEVIEIATKLLPRYEAERDRLERIDWWCRWRQEPLVLPRKSTTEHRELEKLSHTPWLALVVSSVAQCMYVDSWRSSRDTGAPGEEPSGPWRTWLANSFDRRQIALHRAVLSYGYAYITVLPGHDWRGEPMSVMRGVSPRKGYAVYADPAVDDWPEYAIYVDGTGESRTITVYDEAGQYTLSGDGDELEVTDRAAHGAGVCPWIRVANQLDLDGRATGEVEPNIGAAARINKTAYDRLLVQHFNSWKVRTVAGMTEPDTPEEKERTKLLLRQEDLLVAEDADTKFGTLDETPLEGFIGAWRADIEALAAVTQTPTYALTGQLVNLSAEALAMARSSLDSKVDERQRLVGGAYGQALRLSAALEGDDESAQDVTARVTWQDTSIRSLAQAVDALGKAATMLQVPPQALWGRIPGVEKTDVDDWLRMAREADPVERMRASLVEQV